MKLLTYNLAEAIATNHPIDQLCWGLISFGILTIAACVGSFFTVLCARNGIPFNAQKTRSECLHCHRQLGLTENIPIFGWLLLRGKCKGCKTPIPTKYILSELTHLGLWSLILSFYGPTSALIAGPLLSFSILKLQKQLWNHN